MKRRGLLIAAIATCLLAGTQDICSLPPSILAALWEKESSLALVRGAGTEPLALGEDAIISGRVDPAPSIEAPVVFAGYALAVPELDYDDLAGLGLRRKVVLYITGGPSNIPGTLHSPHQSPAERDRFPERAGVVGIIAIPNPRHMDLPWQRSLG